MQVSPFKEASHLLDFSTFDDSGYDTCTTRVDDNDSIEGAGLWAAEQLAVLDAEAPRPSAAETVAALDVEVSLPAAAEQPEILDTEDPFPPVAVPLDTSATEVPPPPVAINFDDYRDANEEEHEVLLKRLGSRRWPLGICTMPRLNSRNGVSKLHPRPSLKSFYGGSNGKRSSGSLRSPDRFLSSVDCQDSSVQKFRVNKDPRQLSPSEKIVRDDSVSLDAFSPRRNFTTPNAPVTELTRGNAAPTRSGGKTPYLFMES
jgi:hypothetical protein